jgi:hypothetical protein
LLQIQELVGGSTLQLQCILMFLLFILACADTVFAERLRSSYFRVSKSRKLAKEEAAYIFLPKNLINYFLIVKEDFEK